MNSLRKKRALLTTKIWRYEQWRNNLRKKFPKVSFPFKRGPIYHQALAPINKQLKLWYRQLKKYDMLSNKIIALGNIVSIFMGMNPKNIGKTVGNERAWRTRAFFYKMGIELKIEQKLLREYVGSKRVLQPTEDRKKLNQLLAKDTEVIELWNRFKKYYDEFPVASSDFIDKRKAPGS